ncbi:proline-rich protein 3-like [Cucurbita moschata]|uniref:Proline-rich protein 3-like n=1 Tax=Cucurbita moschata TaxID=3662 RepID=A0A6J1GP42_CUCMO|nr:proline-rich protein 3-like [Cucurbita moschata]
MALARRLIAATPVVLLWLLAAASVSSAADYYEFPDDQNFGGAGDNGIPIYEKPLPSYGREVAAPLLIAVEGVVSCRNNTQYHPLKGVVARITCMGLNEKGNEMAPFSFSSFPSDEHGYFLATLSVSKLKGKAKVTECKAFLPPSSPCEGCKYLTNVNNGVLGALFRSFRILTHRNMKLYSVGPFLYSSYLDPLISSP